MGSLHVLPTAQQALEDEDIKLLARSDKRRAMDLVVRKYRERILRHALYVMRDYQEAFDVTQEVFIRGMREQRFFDAEFRIKPWLFRVTSNLCFNLVRDRRRRGVLIDAMPKLVESPADQVDAIFSDERQKLLLDAMERLSEDHREILNLRYYSDLSYVEIGDALGIKLGTVMSRLSRAKGRLTEVLDDAGFEWRPDARGDSEGRTGEGRG